MLFGKQAKPLTSEPYPNYETRLFKIQRLRGNVYLEDNALPPSALTPDGRLQSRIDEECWHPYITDFEGQIVGCLRIRRCAEHVTLENLSVNEFVERLNGSGERHRKALEKLINSALRGGLAIGEVSGWAVAGNWRNRRATMMLPFSAWAIYSLIGGAIVLSAATRRHDSAEILLRMGGFRIQADNEKLPPFYDSLYQCEMEFIAYDSRWVNPKYQEMVHHVCSQLRVAGP